MPTSFCSIDTPDRRRSGPDRQLPAVVLLLLLGAVFPVAAKSAFAFHDGGTANCEACHVMHDAASGEVLMDGSSPLLTAATASDVCLSCHGGVDGVLADNPLLPGPERGAGNFVFLLEDNINDGADGQIAPIGGHAAGHSIISLAYGLTGDPRWANAPGGNFPSDQLGCTSCHDPHGNENFRMLNGAGEIQGGISNFIYDAPQAAGLDVTSPTAIEGLTAHTAYVAGMSEWCANCHGPYHNQGGGMMASFRHGFDGTFTRARMNRYNTYEGTASPSSGTWATAYVPEVPFEDATATTSRTAGPTSGSRVMCLTCHRAHATSAPAAGRWDFRVENLQLDGSVSGSYSLPSPYAGAQGQLCAKCHVGGVAPPNIHAE